MAKSTDRDCIVLEKNKKSFLYTIKDDFFTEQKDFKIKSKTKIVSCKSKKITPHFTKRHLYNFRNTLKKCKLNEYSMLNTINTISDTEKNSLLTFIKACADIMEFDADNYDYDTLMQYLLSSNQNFSILTDMDCTLTKNDENIFIVNAEYIDHILQTYFNITPAHPAVNSLISRGFCVDNGYYYYRNIFNTFYATDVIDIEAVYKLNTDTYYTVFTDIYRQGNTSFPEYSYAVIRKTDNGTYNLLKLGMGKPFLSTKELESFNHIPANHVWNNKVTATDTSLLYALLLAVISFGAVAVLCGVILIIQYIRCK